MKNKFLNKIAENVDFKRFNLFQLLHIQKINERVKDRKSAFSQQAVDQLIINIAGV